MTDNVRKIEVLGPGCNRCKETYRIVQEVVAQSGMAADVTKDESLERMVALGLLATPGVVVDGVVVLSGRVPKPGDVRKLLGLAPEP